MAEWLGDTPIFQRTMTDEERRDFALFKTKVKANESKENDMAKKNAAQTTIDAIANEEDTTMTENTAANVNTESKENTTMTITGIPMKARKNGNEYYDRPTDVERHVAIRKATKLGRTKAIEATTCIPGESLANISKDPAEWELLGKAAAKFGWTNGVCTVSKALKYHGTPNPEYTGHGWFVEFATHKSETDGTIAYPMEAFVWATESGLPEFDEEADALRKARKAKTAMNRAKRALKEANDAAGIKTPRRKATSKKPAAKATIANDPVPMAAPAKLIHIRLANGVEFDARDAKEAAELKALFE